MTRHDSNFQTDEKDTDCTTTTTAVNNHSDEGWLTHLLYHQIVDRILRQVGFSYQHHHTRMAVVNVESLDETGHRCPVNGTEQ